mmetsp:Transcript_14222/g.21278  ORF Transcript_14222/g.21278 Transcript_14222/m.21278 type:complete len:590 (+) Transcript_14222:78-1847(+)|eukprot:CAMPEP_0185033358 /NCGR_PEP_ID=MMETSP1103-20130426/22204_1 /TAXON_ID=36769 /ORGANISM="Paraphysomonas bandaiensis, Strain Caron Lab Isolate" /LENGTH=589 /DNA_ID=CAMNT_0027569587 /DNA_START=47 /DNA_END=1816 /DNA_ORIENTATION=+
MLRRFSAYRSKGEEQSRGYLKVLFHVDVSSVHVQASDIVTDDSVLSACFVSGGKMAATSDQELTTVESGDFLANFDERLSLVVNVTSEGEGKYQSKRGKIVIRQRKKNSTGPEYSYDGVGSIPIPLDDMISADTRDPVSPAQNISLFVTQAGDSKKGATISITVTSKILSVGENLGDEGELSGSDQEDEDFMSIAADFTRSENNAIVPSVENGGGTDKSKESVSIGEGNDSQAESSRHDEDDEDTVHKRRGSRKHRRGSRRSDEENAYRELLAQYWELQQHTALKEERIARLETEMVELIEGLNMRKGSAASSGGTVVEFSALKDLTVTLKKNMWKEQTANEAIRKANSRADERMAAALAEEKERAEKLQEEYVEACLQIKQLEEENSALQSQIDANAAILSTPGREHLQRHLDSLDFSSPSLRASMSLSPPATPVSSPLPTYGKAAESEVSGSVREEGTDSEKRVQTQDSVGSVTKEAVVQDLVTSKMLLASMATELQEEKHMVAVLSRQNQKYAERLASLEVAAVVQAEAIEELERDHSQPAQSSRGLFRRRTSSHDHSSSTTPPTRGSLATPPASTGNMKRRSSII